MTEPEQPIVFNAEDRLTPTWVKLMKYCDRRIARLRLKNDDYLPVEDTLAIRAEIKALKGIKQLEKVSPEID